MAEFTALARHRSYCRLCSGLCGTEVTLDAAGRLREVRADRAHAMSLGYACSKGLAAPETHNHPDRIRQPLKRLPDGRHVPVPLEEAMEEIAERVRGIVASSGPDAIGGYRGTASYLNALSLVMLPLWLRALGSSSLFSTMTIDQSAKWVCAERLGRWHAGRHPFERAEVALIFGANPLVSVQGGLGISSLNPQKRLTQARARGLKLIVVDPRHTELARQADLHLQVYPGEDVAVAAGMLHLILREGWHDAAFCAQWVGDLAPLRAALAGFTPEHVAHRAGIAAADLVLAARMFAREARIGAASTGTGPDMGPHSNLAEHLVECLNVICGRYQRAGDVVGNPGVMSEPSEFYAEVRPPRRGWEQEPRSRVRGLGRLMGEKMSGALADEILQPGEGRLRGLIVVGGNPAMALPNQQRAVKALTSLDLLVAIEPFMTGTARLAHYVLPPKLQYERPDIPTLADPGYYPEPFAQYTPTIAAAPGPEVMDEWWYFWSLGRRLRKPVRFKGWTLDGPEPPTSEALLERLVAKARVPFDRWRDAAGGVRVDVATTFVHPARETARDARFAVLPPDVEAELAQVLLEPPVHASGELLLCVKRMRQVLNTALHNHSSVQRLHPDNPLAINPTDLQRLGIADGHRVRVTGRHGTLETTVQADVCQRQGVVSMSHGWGGLPGEPDGRGACASVLVSDAQDVEPINGMPRMTALPVRIERIQGDAE